MKVFILVLLFVMSSFAAQSSFDLMERANALYRSGKFKQAILLYRKAEARGKGYAAELVEAATRFIASRFGIRVMHGRVVHGNEASARVLEKNGYRFAEEEFGAEDDPYGNGMLVYRKEC